MSLPKQQLHSMKRSQRIILLALLLASLLPATSFAETSSLFPHRKQKPAFYLKLYYYTPSYNYIGSLRSDLDEGAFRVFSHTTIGAGYRIPIWRSLYIQPEIHYGIATNWDEAAQKNTFFGRVIHAFNIRDYNYFDIPLYIGLRWQPITLFAARAYAGPLVQFSLSNKQFGLVGQYSLTCGAGLDLFNFISFDIGYRVGMQELTFLEETSIYFLSASFKL